MARSRWSALRSRASLHRASSQLDGFSDDDDEMDQLAERLGNVKMMEGELVSSKLSWHLARRLSSRRSSSTTDASSMRTNRSSISRAPRVGVDSQRHGEKEDGCSPALAEVLTVQAQSKERFLANKAEGYKISVTSFGESKFFKQLAHEEEHSMGATPHAHPKVAGEAAGMAVAEVDANPNPNPNPYP